MEVLMISELFGRPAISRWSVFCEDIYPARKEHVVFDDSGFIFLHPVTTVRKNQSSSSGPTIFLSSNEPLITLSQPDSLAWEDEDGGEEVESKTLLRSIGLEHILDGHAYGLDNEKGQFLEDLDKAALKSLVEAVVERPELEGPSVEEGRVLLGRTFDQTVGWVCDWETGEWTETRHLLAVLNEETGHVVTAFPVRSLPRFL